MIAIKILLLVLLLVSPSCASPLSSEPKIDHNKVFLCPQTGSLALNVSTALGTAWGSRDISGQGRFTVKYATASRWAPSTIVSTWGFQEDSMGVTALPLACPQPGVDPSAYTEDCLSMVLYIPLSLSSTSGAPTLMWIHGGSFIVGSASQPGLDGSKLAAATNSIVAVVQYRLGALGFMAPDGTTNLAAQDLVNAMQFLKKVVPSFGGSASKITLAGQSSGANMIRALLAVPSASSLFKSAILQSDPMNYGFLAPSTQQALQTNYNSLINCGAKNTSCWNALSLDTILNTQTTLFNNAVNIDPSTGPAQPIRPVRDGSFITSPLDSTAPFPAVNKPILISSVLDEAGFAIYNALQSLLPESLFAPICNVTFGENRTQTILASPHYTVTTSPADGSPDARVQLQLIGTDYLWRCSSWTFARNWVQNGGSAYVGLYIVGATYPGNEVVSFCTQPGSVCHQDDIEIVFGTVNNPTAAQTALITEMQSRYKAFLYNGKPSAAGFQVWSPATSSDVHALLLGGSGEANVGACNQSFWGQSVQYDYQVFGI